MATTTAAIIKAEFPEFDELTDAYIDAKIADATGRVGAEAWGALADQAIKYLACHLLAMSPLGEQSKLELKSGPDAGVQVTTYLLEYRRLLAQSGAAAACGVI